MTKRRLSTSQPTNLAKRLIAVETLFDDGMQEINTTISHLDTSNIDAAETIEQTTTMLNELDEARAKLLAIRAQALMKQAKVDKAIADVSKAIDKCPTSCQLYIVASELHCAQGKFKQAVDILENGIRSVLPSDWPALYIRRESAKRSLDERVDFVSVMPPEVTARIFMCLNDMMYGSTTLVNCSLVSKVWRAATLGCSSLWEEAYCMNIRKSNATFDLLPVVCNHVKCIRYDKLPEQPFQVLCELATRGMLKSVTTLEFGTYISNCELQLIRTLGKQLTELRFATRSGAMGDNALYFDTILASCQNLKTLRVLWEGEVQYRAPQVPIMDPLNLEVLIYYTTDRDDAFLQHLIPRCRQLRSLNVAYCPRDALELATTHCLQLEEISIFDNYSAFDDIWMTKEFKEHQQPTTGLRRLEYRSQEGNELRDLVPVWTNHKDTLQELILWVANRDIERTEQMVWDSLATGPYPQLKILQLDFARDAGAHVVSRVSNLLQACPALEYLSLRIHDVLPNDFFMSLAELPCVRRLEIANLEGTCGGIRQYFEYLSVHNQRCTLKDIEIDDCSAMTDQDLFALAGLPFLERIYIFGKHTLVTTNGITAFLRRLKSNPNLQYLDLSRMENLSDVCMPALYKLVKLNGNMHNLYKSVRQDRSLIFDVLHYNIARFDSTKRYD